MRPVENIDFSTENPVLISEVLPYPCEAAPATNESLPVTSWLSLSEEATTAVPSSNIRSIGRLEADLSTHFQSSSELWGRPGASWTASKRVLRVTLMTLEAPALKPIRSRKDGRNEGAETLTV